MVATGDSLWAVLTQLYTWAGPCLMLIYPLYRSILAIESPSKADDAQWLTYWVLFYSFVELGFDSLLSWIPFWYTVKLVAVAWLVLPPFRGAAFLYDNYVKQFAGTLTTVKVHRQLNSHQRSILQQMSPGARNTVAHFINEHGTEEFDRIVRSAERDLRKSPRTGNPGESGHFWERSPDHEHRRRWWSSERSPDGEKRHYQFLPHIFHPDRRSAHFSFIDPNFDGGM